jgi:hypothetical protein
MKCVAPEEGRVILHDIHAGVYGSHACTKSLVGKTYWQGFFWPTSMSDVDSIICHCEGYQVFAHQKHVLSHQLQTIHITWHFSTWGLNLVNPFKKAKGAFIHIFIAVDKFTKWVEVKPAATITVAMAMEFIREIMYIFDVPNNIITNNGTQFTMREFKDFCADLGIKINHASVSHPQSNGQVEHSNSMII